MSQHKDSKTGKWYYRFYYINNEGKRIQRKKRGFKGRKEARAAEVAEQERIELEGLNTTSITFKALYIDYIEYSSSELKASTIEATRHKTEKQILPYFGKILIDKITVNDIKKWKLSLKAQGYALRYKRGIFNCLTKILNYGVKYHRLASNVAIKVGNFKDANYMKPEMQIWTLEEFNQFNNVIGINSDVDFIYKVYYNILFWSGARRGEIQALTWNDYVEPLIKINKTCSHKVRGTPYVITPPKTKSSVRTVSLPNNCIELLSKLYYQEKKRKGFNSKCFIFGFDKPLSDTTIETRKNRYSKLAELSPIRIHDFRHSHASILLSRGIRIEVVAKRLGHSDITMTLNTYTHLMPNDESDLLTNINSI